MNGVDNGPIGAAQGNHREVVVAVRNVTKYFDSLWGGSLVRALTNVSFEVERGEVFGLLGPAGSGKSTTLNMLAGRLSPMEGKVEVFGRSPRRRAVRARIGYLAAKRAQPAERRLAWFSRLRGRPSASDGTRPLGGPQEGQSRAALAQALLKNPDLVLLDEPLANLDPALRKEMKQLILTLARSGKTLILTSRSLPEVKDVCRRAAIYHSGRIEALGALTELFRLPGALRFLAPLLPPSTTDRLLEIMREDLEAAGEVTELPAELRDGEFDRSMQSAPHTEAERAAVRTDKVLARLIKGVSEGS